MFHSMIPIQVIRCGYCYQSNLYAYWQRKVIFRSDSSGPRLADLHGPHSVPGVSVDPSVLQDAPLPTELIEDSEVEPRNHQSRLINLPLFHTAML